MIILNMLEIKNIIIVKVELISYLEHYGEKTAFTCYILYYTKKDDENNIIIIY